MRYYNMQMQLSSQEIRPMALSSARSHWLDKRQLYHIAMALFRMRSARLFEAKTSSRDELLIPLLALESGNCGKSRAEYRRSRPEAADAFPSSMDDDDRIP